jgi:hypothetical protein
MRLLPHFVQRVGLGKGQNPKQGGLKHLQMLHNGPVGDLDLLELNGSSFGTSFIVFADQNQEEKSTVQNQ